MSGLAENSKSRALPPQLELPFGLSFHDSFSLGGRYVDDDVDTSHDAVRDIESMGDSPSPEHNYRRIPRKPVAAASIESISRMNDPRTPMSATNASTALLGDQPARITRRIYWIIPSAAIALFLVGLAVAIGHYAYLLSLNENPPGNQMWVNRYSLAMAFIVKATLGAAISIALTQSLWHCLQHLEKGISISAMDALFALDVTPVALLSWDMWRTTFVPALMAVCIWLMPLITVVAPTALTVASSSRSLNNSKCMVPVLRMGDLPKTSASLSLFDVDYEGIQFAPSSTCHSIVDLTAQNGRQLGWPSPCGSNCTYDIMFEAPSWQCKRIEDPTTAIGPYLYPSYWFGDVLDGSKVDAGFIVSELEYVPIYYASYNNQTTQFWVGVTDRVYVDDPVPSMTEQEYLNLHLYCCEFMNTTYHLKVSYVDHQQTNEVVDYSYISQIQISPDLWDGSIHGFMSDATSLGVASLYSTLAGFLQGEIDRDPRVTLNSATDLGSIPPLVRHFQDDLYIPVLEIGPLLEELSRNISISLLSFPGLDTTNTTITTCTIHDILTVWKFNPTPLVLAYAIALGAALLCLIIGGQALRASGVARDKSFSSIVRSTRNRDLDLLSMGEEDVALPLPPSISKQRLRFSGVSTSFSATTSDEKKRMSFQFVEKHAGVEMQPQ